MKLPGLVNVLNGLTGIPFTEWAWSEAPEEPYGVITLDGQTELKADADPVAEKMRTGYVDVYTKAGDPDPTEAVEAALKAIGIWFRMESVQFEPESGLLHFEWIWIDTLNVVTKQLYVIKFKDKDGYIGDPQIVEDGAMPVVPTVSDYIDDEILYRFRRWNEPVTAASKNAEYVAEYYIEIQIMKSGSKYYARNYSNGSLRWFTSDQIDTIIAWFDAGNVVGCLWNNSVIRADECIAEYVKATNIIAYWSL